MTSDELVEKALRRILPAPTPEQRTALRTALALRVDEARQRLAEAVNSSDRPERRQLLVTEYAATITEGVITLSALTDAAGNPLRESLARAEIYSDSSDYRWQYKGSRSVLSLQRTDGDFIYYTVSGARIHTTSGDASATVRALRVPTLASLPTELEDELIEILAEFSSEEEAAA